MYVSTFIYMPKRYFYFFGNNIKLRNLRNCDGINFFIKIPDNWLRVIEYIIRMPFNQQFRKLVGQHALAFLFFCLECVGAETTIALFEEEKRDGA